jgi:hypothetical protein
MRYRPTLPFDYLEGVALIWVTAVPQVPHVSLRCAIYTASQEEHRNRLEDDC